MARWLLVLAVALVLAVHGQAWAAPAVPVRVAPTPAWVEPFDGKLARGTPASGGVALEVIDVQDRFVGGQRWHFMRTAVRIDNELGVESAGQRRFGFTPPYQRLVLHRLEIRRGDSVIPHLDIGKVQVMRREVGLDDNVEDGERTAIVVLPDLRVGDVVYTEFSVVGENPVFAGHVMESWLLGLDVAIGSERHRALSDHPLDYRSFAAGVRLIGTRRGALYNYETSATDVPATDVAPGTPDDYDDLPWLQLSDFDSWQAVVRWGNGLFRLPDPPSPAVARAAREIAGKATTHTEQVRAVIRAVEERIRYLSLALGQSSHRPASPEDVLERRFGDCKDKSLLAVALLRALGFDADVALAGTSAGMRATRMLPTIDAFDHVIVVVQVDGSSYWLDPTRHYQRGSLAEMAVHAPEVALVLAPATERLTRVPPRSDTRPDVTVDQHYVVSSFGGPTRLAIVATYRHDRAEMLRAYHASSSAEFDKNMVAQVLDAHPKAKLIGRVAYVDNESSNEIVLSHQYRLDACWSTSAAGRVDLVVRPVGFMRRLIEPKQDRKLPLAIEFPLSVAHDVTVSLPEPIKISDKPIDEYAESVGFVFKPEREGNDFLLHYRLVTYGRSVESSELPAYRALVDKISNAAAITVFKVDTRKGERALSWIFGIAAFWGLALVALVVVAQRVQPWLPRPRVMYRPELGRRKGWLAFLGVVVTLTPLRIGFGLLPLYSAAQRQGYAVMMSPGSSSFTPQFGLLLGFETLGNLTTLVGFAYVFYLYWAKRRSFPLVFISVALFNMGFLVADMIVGQRSIESVAGTLGAVFVAVLWIIYVLNSERVRAVFLPAAD